MHLAREEVAYAESVFEKLKAQAKKETQWPAGEDAWERDQTGETMWDGGEAGADEEPQPHGQ